MEWLINLIGPGHEELASTLVLYSFVIALGVYLGKFKIWGISLGVTFVLFVGIVMGHFGYVVNPEVLRFVREFGLILFIFAIGIQVGPGFFSSFRSGGVTLNALSLLGVLVAVGTVLAIYYIDGRFDITALIGVMSGAVTNTPGLAAAQQTAGTPEAVNIMAMGYAAAYPLGVLGIIGSMLLLKAVFRVKTDEETAQIEKQQEEAQARPQWVSFEVTNKLIDGHDMRDLHRVLNCDFVISRVMDGHGRVVIPNATTKIHLGDKVSVICTPDVEEKFQAVVGPKIDVDWEDVPSQVYSRRVVITRSKYDGMSLAQLHLPAAYKLNCTRVNRAGIDLLASPHLRLQLGDRLTVVGDLNDIDRLASLLGNSLKRLNQPNLITIFVGILLGIILGSINVGFGMKLGLAGGPLVVAILLSRFGYKLKLVTYTSSAASALMRELGICLFLASVGISSGADFAQTVFNATGAWWVLYGFLITVVPLLVVGVIARGYFKINYLTIMGLMGGTYTDPPALAYAGNSTSSDVPAVAYSTVYPFTMFLRVVAAQALVLCFM